MLISEHFLYIAYSELPRLLTLYFSPPRFSTLALSLSLFHMHELELLPIGL